MKRIFLISILILASLTFCCAQYNKAGTILTAGINSSRYLGNGEGGNWFGFSKPGFQAELTSNSGRGFEWIIYGVAHFSTFNNVGKNKAPVEFWIPYYTEFLFYQKTAKNPLFWFFGYDYVRMKFPEMKKPDSHYNLTFGAGWNIRLFDQLYLQLKAKPYVVFGNSIGQHFGFNGLANLHLNLAKRSSYQNGQQ